MVRRVVSPTARLVVRSHFSHLSWKVVVPCAISNPIRRISPHEPAFLSPSAQDLRMIAPHRASLSTRSPCSTPNSWIFGGHREQWPCHRNGPSAGEFSSKTAPPSQRVSTTHVQPDRERSDDDSLGPRLSSTRDRYHRSGRVKSFGPRSDIWRKKKTIGDGASADRQSVPERRALTRALAKVALRGDGAGSSSVPNISYEEAGHERTEVLRRGDEDVQLRSAGQGRERGHDEGCRTRQKRPRHDGDSARRRKRARAAIREAQAKPFTVGQKV